MYTFFLRESCFLYEQNFDFIQLRRKQIESGGLDFSEVLTSQKKSWGLCLTLQNSDAYAIVCLLICVPFERICWLISLSGDQVLSTQ